jgi:hypothetical protein
MYIKDILYDSCHFPHKAKLHFIHLGMAHPWCHTPWFIQCAIPAKRLPWEFGKFPGCFSQGRHGEWSCTMNGKFQFCWNVSFIVQLPQIFLHLRSLVDVSYGCISSRNTQTREFPCLEEEIHPNLTTLAMCMGWTSAHIGTMVKIPNFI